MNDDDKQRTMDAFLKQEASFQEWINSPEFRKALDDFGASDAGRVMLFLISRSMSYMPGIAIAFNTDPVAFMGFCNGLVAYGLYALSQGVNLGLEAVELPDYIEKAMNDALNKQEENRSE